MAASKPLTPTQRRILGNLAAGRPADAGAYGLSQHGGFGGSLKSLVRRGYVVWVLDHPERTYGRGRHVLTSEGRAAIG